MVDRVIALSGQIYSGKTSLAKSLEARYRISTFKTKDALVKRLEQGGGSDRGPLQAKGAVLDRSTGGKWVVQELIRWLGEADRGSCVIVDSVRIRGQIQALREAYGSRVVHIHLTAPDEVLVARFKKRRQRSKDADISYAQAKDDPTEAQVETLSEIADAVIDTARCTEEDVLARAEGLIHAHPHKGLGYVDVVVGGQYGSEGKGQIVSFIAREYDLLVRVGGPNAGHKVFGDPPYTHHQLPSGTRYNTEARLLIGPGAVLNVEKLVQEIADCGVDSKRLVIDRNAMVIEPRDIKAELKLKRDIGSTGSGTGAATSRRIMGRHKGTKLARDISALRPYLGDAFRVLEDAYLNGQRVLLEGTQGTGLSIYHGDYPYVTSRDTTAGGCLAEAGIPPRWVRRVMMIVRTYPIRVQSPTGGTSGPLNDVGWAEVSRRSGIPVSELRAHERTSTTNRRRRVGEFDWALVHRSALLNGATDIALTFADYINRKNRDAVRFDQLTQETIRFIDEVGRVAGVPVTMVAVGFNHRSVIDRRAWEGA
ncbi:MAG: adenylosuccinate synthetase [Thermoplasmata archaeon]|nr:adenylosuccinate synthetase [Thermoplasmata archaeon]